VDAAAKISRVRFMLVRSNGSRGGRVEVEAMLRTLTATRQTPLDGETQYSFLWRDGSAAAFLAPLRLCFEPHRAVEEPSEHTSFPVY
jgi:hypothetical protein